MKITDIVDSIIEKTNANTTDVITTESRLNSHIGLSGVTGYHLLEGNLAVDNTVTTQGFNTTLYTSGSAITNIDMSTQWGNDSSEKFGGLVWLKDRAEATNNFLYDTIRGATKEINSNTTEAEATLTNGLTEFNSTGFTVGADAGHNSTTNNMASWNFQTTHRVSGTTNHGKAYTCHFNPFTGFTIVKYEGSGIAGHEIPHHLGRKLGFSTMKDLGSANDWTATRYYGSDGWLNKTDAFSNIYGYTTTEAIHIIPTTSLYSNVVSHQYIMYGWANSYIDESNKLIGNYEIGVYQSTGASGNKVVTRGKPAWLMIKCISSVQEWLLIDNQRGTGLLMSNTSGSETSTLICTFNSDGFTLQSGSSYSNASGGGQYLYMVAYDTNSNGGGSYYPRATDTSNLQVQNAIIPFANGIDSNGVKITTLSKNETFSGVTFNAGKNYPYYDNTGARGKSTIMPNYGVTNPANGGDFHNLITKKWYTSAGTEITTSRNYMNTIVYADNDGSPLYVEELPKVEYKDSLQVNELNVLSKFNLNQTWQDMRTQRSSGATYTNPTMKPIMVICGDTSSGGGTPTWVVGGLSWTAHTNTNSVGVTSVMCFIVPPGVEYKYTGQIDVWNELR